MVRNLISFVPNVMYKVKLAFSTFVMHFNGEIFKFAITSDIIESPLWKTGIQFHSDCCCAGGRHDRHATRTTRHPPSFRGHSNIDLSDIWRTPFQDHV